VLVAINLQGLGTVTMNLFLLMKLGLGKEEFSIINMNGTKIRYMSIGVVLKANGQTEY